MKSDELSGYIGEIDDELIINAKKSRPKYKNILLIVGSMAACITIAGAGIFDFMNRKPKIYNGYTEKGTEISSGITTGGASLEIPHTEESYESDIEIITSDIFYVKEGKIEKTPMEHQAKPEAVFELWKKMNNIGDDVKFISVKIDSNGSTEESEYNGQSVATYHVGDNFIYNLTITKNIESYYSRTRKYLLLSSLEQTMYESAEIKIGEFNLILAEG